MVSPLLTRSEARKSRLSSPLGVPTLRILTLWAPYSLQALASHPLQGWSAPLYAPESPQGAERVLLAGDAVGVDPWLGEGISVALGTGILAAHAAADGLARGDLDFTDHARRIHESGVGFILARQQSLADPFYAAAARSGGLEPFVGREATQ